MIVVEPGKSTTWKAGDFLRYGEETFASPAFRNFRGKQMRSGSSRTDLSATLFFPQPDEYDGGDLIVEGTYGTAVR
jgi:PKHD-type hydroxylase